MKAACYRVAPKQIMSGLQFVAIDWLCAVRKHRSVRFAAVAAQLHTAQIAIAHSLFFTHLPGMDAMLACME